MLTLKSKAKIFVGKEGDTFIPELKINDTTINKNGGNFLINLADYEGQTLEGEIVDKVFYLDGKEIVKYDNLFQDIILDAYVENGICNICLGNIILDSFNSDLNLHHYKVNVKNDDSYVVVRYANLHQHTENSLLDGIVRIKDLAKKSEYACAITDHGNMFGWYDMLTEFNKLGKKALIGEEFYLETLGGPRLTYDISGEENLDEIMFDNSRVQNEKGLNGEHLIVIAKNNKGIKNLFKLSSEASNHFNRRPHITFELLEKYKEGLIVCSACIGSGLNQFIKEYLKCAQIDSVKEWIEAYGEDFYNFPEYQAIENSVEEVYVYNHKKSREYIDWFKEKFGEDFYLEYQDHNFELEKIIMDEMVRIRDEEYPDIKIVATCDGHYLDKEDSYVHELWLCNQTQKTIYDEKRMRFSGEGYYTHTSEEMLNLFPVEYLDNTLEVMNKIQYEPLESGYHLPHFPLPKGFDSEVEYFKHCCREGFKEKFRNTPHYKDQVYLDRMCEEIDTIVGMGWASYFLIVSDFIKWAEDTEVAKHPEIYFPHVPVNEIPKEFLKDYQIYTGSGRGCVCAGTKIYTKDSLENIEDLKVGDFVRTHTGKLLPILKTHKYDINEPLYKIHCLFGDNYGNAYTADHKILVVKHIKETNRSKIAKGNKYKDPNLKPEWISAKDVEIGDYVLQPVFSNEYYEKIKKIDLSKFLKSSDIHFTIKENEIIWKRPLNYPTKRWFSGKTVRREAGIDSEELRKILNGEKTKNIDKVEIYLFSKGMLLEEFIERYDEINYITESFPRYLPITEDLMYILGLMTGDGWTRKNNSEWGICFNSESEYEKQLELFEKTLNIKMGKVQKHKEKKLVQISNGCVVYKRFFEEFWCNSYEYTANTKNFQNWVLGLETNLRKAFLNGLWEADGSNKVKTAYDSTSWKLISKIKILLSSLGIANGVAFRPEHYSEKGEGKNCKDSWKITVPKNFGDNKSVRNVIYFDNFVGKRVDKIEQINDEKFVYDITVQEDHSYVTSSYIAHNSGAGSLVNYVLGITKVEPLEYDLKFERFLNPDRISMPDIDTDFQDNLRPKVLDYVRFKYGRSKVANIITFGTAAAKNSVKIINRVLGGNVERGNRISDLITESTIDKSLKSADFAKTYETDKEIKNIVDLAKKIEGLKTSQSIHPCGVLVCDKKITEYMPEILMVNPQTGEKEWTTQMEGPACETLGCLKMDFLGLRTLGYVHEAIDLIKKNTSNTVVYDEIPLNDTKVYAHLAKGNTASIFQVESDMFTSTIKKVLQDYDKADGDEEFDRLVAMNALVRPGSNIFIDDFADRIIHPEKITYLVPELEPILKDTYGIILFQEQTMRITRDLAGFSMGQADTVRKAMGKKKKEIMDEYKDYFVHGNVEKGIKGCVANGIDETKASKLWDIMALAASYSFNKSHAVAYSMHSIRTAWLSYYHPYEYLTAVLNSFSDDTDKLSQYLTVARNNGMEIKPPLLNESQLNFTTDGKYILAGLSGIKGVAGSASLIIEERQNGKFIDLRDFLTRMSNYSNFNKRTLESLVFAGVLDEFDGTRKSKLQNLEVMSEYVKKLKEYKKKIEIYKDKLEKFPTLLEEYENTPKVKGVRKVKPRMPKEPIKPELNLVKTNEELDKLEMMLKEKKYTGMFLSGNPLTLFEDIADVKTSVAKIQSGKQTVTGVIIDCEKKTSKKGNSFWTFTIENDGVLKCVAFKYDGVLEADMIVQLTGNVETDEFGTTLLVNEVKDLGKVKSIIDSLSNVCLEVETLELGKKLRKIKFKKGTRTIYVLYKGKKKVFAENVEIDIYAASKIIETIGLNRVSFCV